MQRSRYLWSNSTCVIKIDIRRRRVIRDRPELSGEIASAVFSSRWKTNVSLVWTRAKMNETYVSICGYTIVGQLQKQAVTSNAIRCQSECHFVNFHSGQGRRPRFRFVLRRINWPFVKCFEYRDKFTTKVHRVYNFSS